ncbi:hypothetical protein [Actibacterium sp. MT2.3-13A]|uniref:hypothetical protein n=1 Tax=Actibacterium sp. MT2.3-13A TaxID=2828332 RepID=UPI001BA85859|nr:hypothetical protein [Actibacterium sp. MT2.3-13A]
MSPADFARLAALMAGLSAVGFADMWCRTPRGEALALAMLAAGAMLATLPGG